jgi:hypothetical protein
VTLDRDDDIRFAEKDAAQADLRTVSADTADELDAMTDEEAAEAIEIRAEIEETREEMGGTLNELGDRLEPGLLDLGADLRDLDLLLVGHRLGWIVLVGPKVRLNGILFGQPNVVVPFKRHFICSLTNSTFSRTLSAVCVGAISVLWICFTPIDAMTPPATSATAATMSAASQASRPSSTRPNTTAASRTRTPA